MAKKTYEASMKRLAEIVDELENGSLSLDDSLKLFEEGTKLAAFCNTCLDAAEQKVTELSELEEQGVGDNDE